MIITFAVLLALTVLVSWDSSENAEPVQPMRARLSSRLAIHPALEHPAGKRSKA